jgi:hypothetical protein
MVRLSKGGVFVAVTLLLMGKALGQGQGTKADPIVLECKLIGSATELVKDPYRLDFNKSMNIPNPMKTNNIGPLYYVYSIFDDFTAFWQIGQDDFKSAYNDEVIRMSAEINRTQFILSLRRVHTDKSVQNFSTTINRMTGQIHISLNWTGELFDKTEIEDGTCNAVQLSQKF